MPPGGAGGQEDSALRPTVWVGVHRLLSCPEEKRAFQTGQGEHSVFHFGPIFHGVSQGTVGGRALRQVGGSGGTALGFKERLLLGRWSREGNQ